MASKIAMNGTERHHVGVLRAWIPNPLPAGWTSPRDDIARANEYQKPGIFARLVSSKAHRLYFEAKPDGTYTATLSRHLGAVLSQEEIAQVEAQFFSGKKTKVSVLLPGLAHFDLLA